VKRFTAPTLADIKAIAAEAFASLPESFRRHVGSIVFHVEEFPDAETERDMRLESPFDLLGLYRGVPLDHKDAGGQPQDLDRIFLYRRPILDYWCEEDEDLTHLIRHVLIHEIGHHFGLSDEAMEAIERETEEGS
jgi:predicted Zn-dependent protease with MMP-like domain